MFEDSDYHPDSSDYDSEDDNGMVVDDPVPAPAPAPIVTATDDLFGESSEDSERDRAVAALIEGSLSTDKFFGIIEARRHRFLEPFRGQRGRRSYETIVDDRNMVCVLCRSVPDTQMKHDNCHRLHPCAYRANYNLIFPCAYYCLCNNNSKVFNKCPPRAHPQLLDDYNIMKTTISSLNETLGDAEDDVADKDEKLAVSTQRIQCLEQQLQQLHQQAQQQAQQQTARHTSPGCELSQLSTKQLIALRRDVLSEIDARIHQMADCAAATCDGYVVADVAGTSDKPTLLCPSCNRLVTKRSVSCDGQISGRQPSCPLCRHPRSAAGWQSICSGSMQSVPRVPAHVLDTA
jgi:hypothetical protein